MRKSRPLTEIEYQQEAENSFKQIFEADTLFGELHFTSNIAKRTILYPVVYQLTQFEFQSLIQAIRIVEDDALYVSLLEPVTDVSFPNHWFIPLEDVNTYFSLDSAYKVLENAVYSPRGQWGLRATMDQYAIVGGSHLFIDTLFKHLSTSANEQTSKFMNHHDIDSTNLVWLRNFLAHLFGQEKAQQLMTEAKLL